MDAWDAKEYHRHRISGRNKNNLAYTVDFIHSSERITTVSEAVIIKKCFEVGRERIVRGVALEEKHFCDSILTAEGLDTIPIHTATVTYLDFR